MNQNFIDSSDQYAIVCFQPYNPDIFDKRQSLQLNRMLVQIYRNRLKFTCITLHLTRK